jgi:hypothetical protein
MTNPFDKAKDAADLAKDVAGSAKNAHEDEAAASQASGVRTEKVVTTVNRHRVIEKVGVRRRAAWWPLLLLAPLALLGGYLGKGSKSSKVAIDTVPTVSAPETAATAVATDAAASTVVVTTEAPSTVAAITTEAVATEAVESPATAVAAAVTETSTAVVVPETEIAPAQVVDTVVATPTSVAATSTVVSSTVSSSAAANPADGSSTTSIAIGTAGPATAGESDVAFTG